MGLIDVCVYRECTEKNCEKSCIVTDRAFSTSLTLICAYTHTHALKYTYKRTHARTHTRVIAHTDAITRARTQIYARTQSHTHARKRTHIRRNDGPARNDGRPYGIRARNGRPYGLPAGHGRPTGRTRRSRWTRRSRRTRRTALERPRRTPGRPRWSRRTWRTRNATANVSNGAEMRDGSGGDDDYDDGNEDDEDNDEDNDDEMVFRLSPCSLTPYDDVSLVRTSAASVSLSILLFIVIPFSSSSSTFLSPPPPPPPRLAFHSVYLQFHPALSLSSNWFRSDALRNDSLFHVFVVIFSSSVVALHPLHSSFIFI